jgi:Flp pilus assembly protein TadB
VTALLVAVSGLGFGFGLIIVQTAWSTAPSTWSRRAGRVEARAAAVTLTAAMSAGVVLLALTGWAVAAVVGAAAGWAAAAAWQRRGRNAQQEQSRIEALATWCEQLRDLLSADLGVLGTVQATVATCPTVLRGEVSRLATRLSRQDPGRAVRQFAADIDDPSGDLVASVLLLAMSRSGRTAELLSELAVTIRDRASMRLRVEADRSGQRSEARFVVGFGAVVITAVIVFGQNTAFLDAYDSATGQLTLAIVAALYAFGIAWLNRLTRFQRAARFLSVGELNR